MELSIVSFGVIEAFLITLCYFMAASEMIHIAFVFGQPIFLGLLFGLGYGNVTQGVIIGGTLALFYLGNIALAGAVAQDSSLASCIAIPLALKAGLDPATALIIALPFGVVFGSLDNFVRLLRGRVAGKCHAAIDAMNFNGLKFWACVVPVCISFVCKALPLFVILVLAGGGIASLMSQLPPWLEAGFRVIGGVLPPLGMILCANLIGQKKLVPFFLGSFIIVRFSGIGTFTYALLALFAAIIYIQLSPDSAGMSMDNIFKSDGEEKLGVLTKHEQHMLSWRVFTYHRLSNSLEYLYGPSYCVALLPALRKIYKGQDDKLKDALHRHCAPYMTEMSWGNVITGAAIAMEEEIAAGADVSGNQVSTLKTGLMGPMASFGDTINYLTVMPIMNSIVIPFAIQGQVWPAFWGVVFQAFIGVAYVITYSLGYRMGRTSILSLMKSGTLKIAMMGAAVIGMCMMGCQCAKFISLSTPLQFVLNAGTDAENIISVQNILNSLMPDLMPFCFVTGAYFYISKGGKYIYFIIGVIAVALLGSLVGFF